ncbi:UNVERIFIED_CONTAM: hypothetical protein Q9R58_29480 [Methylobacteriaceae bacterium AG10]|nr:hypothetical protein [Methylobacteriaceae bacterium AG10]
MTFSVDPPWTFELVSLVFGPCVLVVVPVAQGAAMALLPVAINSAAAPAKIESFDIISFPPRFLGG